MDENNEIIEQPQSLPPVEQVRRLLADTFKRYGDTVVYSDYLAKKISYKEYLALILWEVVTTGTGHFLEGQALKIDKYGDWLDTVKFLANHLDGPVGNTINTGSVNLYKVYVGIDESKV